jgi:hypothetical protein
MDRTDEKRRESFEEITPRANHSGGDVPVKIHASEGSTTSADDKGEGWRNGWDNRREQRVLRKMDIHLLPFVSLLYLLSFL